MLHHVHYCCCFREFKKPCCPLVLKTTLKSRTNCRFGWKFSAGSSRPLTLITALLKNKLLHICSGWFWASFPRSRDETRYSWVRTLIRSGKFWQGRESNKTLSEKKSDEASAKPRISFPFHFPSTTPPVLTLPWRPPPSDGPTGSFHRRRRNLLLCSEPMALL